MNHPFEVGKEYRNRYGRYVVLAIDGPKMRVRYEDGREINLTIAIQTQILAGIQEAEAAAAVNRPRRKAGTAKKRAPNAGPTKADKREKLIAEILETDDVIFEILTRLVIPPGQINTYRFFLKHPDDFISHQEFADATRDSDQESLKGVLMAFGRRISSSPDPRVSSVKPYNSLFFQRKISDGKTLYRIRRRIVEIFETYPQFHNFLVNDNRAWLPEEFGSENWENNPAVHRAQMQYFGFWERYQDGRGS